MGSSFFCLSSKFIDGRLELLNSGKGFSDAFEEEINMGEYAGSDKTYHQWLFTVKKGSGAIINTVKTKANPAMKTVYKFPVVRYIPLRPCASREASGLSRSFPGIKQHNSADFVFSPQAAIALTGVIYFSF
ncbi:UNVERIFIED_CONTAM: hypothetical protein FKN15_023122 [Acipenser sinensis]